MKSRFRKFWCDGCDFFRYPGECDHGRRAMPAAFERNNLVMVSAAIVEATKVRRRLRVTMLTDFTVGPKP